MRRKEKKKRSVKVCDSIYSKDFEYTFINSDSVTSSVDGISIARARRIQAKDLDRLYIFIYICDIYTDIQFDLLTLTTHSLLMKTSGKGYHRYRKTSRVNTHEEKEEEEIFTRYFI